MYLHRQSVNSKGYFCKSILAMADSSNEEILRQLEEKVLLKSDVLTTTKSVFDELKKLLVQITVDLKSKVKKISKETLIDYRENSDFEFHLMLADETLVFVMHSNVF